MKEITLRYLFEVARKRWLLISTLFVVSTIGVAYVTFFVLTPSYQSTAVVLVKPGREFASSPELGDRGPVMTRMDQIARAEIEILNSEDLLSDAIAELGADRLYPVENGSFDLKKIAKGWLGGLIGTESNGEIDPIHGALARFREDLSASTVPLTEVIRISFSHPDRNLAAESVNVVVEQLKEHHLRAFGEPQSTTFLQAKVAKLREELVAAELKVRDFQEVHPILGVANPAQTLEQHRGQLALSLEQVRNEVAALKQQLGALETHEASLPSIGSVREEYNLQMELQKAGAVAELRAQAARQRGLEQQLAVVEAQHRALPIHLSEYRDLVRDRDSREKRFKIYAERFDSAQLSEEMDRQKIANISVIQRARPPIDPSSPKKLLNLVVGSTLGLGLGFGLALLLEGLRTEESNGS